MLNVKHFHEIQTKDGLALTNLAQQIFSDSKYVIFEGIEATSTGPLTVNISPGRCATLSNQSIIYCNGDVLDLNEIQSQTGSINVIPDGHHALIICYDKQEHKSFWSLVLEIMPGQWDNVPVPDYVVVGVINITSNSITDIVDNYGPWKRVELGIGGGGGSCSGDICLIGCPTDGDWDDGAADIECDDTIADAVDKINELLGYLLPSPPQELNALSFSPSPRGGYISNFTNIGTLTPGQYHDLIFNTSSITGITTNSDRFSNADKGTLNLYFNSSNIDSFDLASHFNEAEREGAQSYPPANSPNGYITVNSVHWYNDFPSYQVGNATVNVSTLVSVGYNLVKLEHVYDTVIDSTPDYIVYYDDAGRPSVSLTFNSISIGNTKWLSGVRYYGQGTTINLSINGTDIFNKTYIDNPVTIESDNNVISTTSIAWNDPNSSGYNTPPNYDDPWQYTNNHNVNNNIAVDRILLSSYGSDPFGSGSSDSINEPNYLINTYNNVSTDRHEYFVDENYRLPINNFDSIPSNITGQWDSTALLSNGNAQVYVDSLIYPHQDFTSGWNPVPQNADYSSFTGDQEYYRAIRDNSSPHNNGSLKIRGIVFSDVGTNVDIFIKLPSQTGWLDLSKAFNAATFSGADGDGCLVSHSQSGDILTLNWSSGTFTTANSGNMYIIRIILHNISVVIEELWDWS